MSECPSRFSLALHSAGDLGDAERAAMEAHLAECEACRMALAETEDAVWDYAERSESERARLLGVLSREPSAFRTTRSRRRTLGLAVAATGFAAAAAVALVIAGPWREARKDGLATAPQGDISFKGGVAFQVVARRGSLQFTVHEGDELRENDALRFVVTTRGEGYLAVMCVEASGRVTAFYPADFAPEGAPWPLRIETAGRRELSGSILLDDSKGNEVYVVLYSVEPFSNRAASIAARALAGGKESPVSSPAFESGVLRVRKAGPNP